MEVLKPFFSWLVISWEMTISGSGQPLLRVTKANNIRVLFSWSSPETSVPLDLLLCCVCAGFGGGFLLSRQCRNPLSLCFVLSEAAADALAINQAGIHCQFGIQSHAGAWMLWDKSFLINSIRNAINSFVQWKKSWCSLLELQYFFQRRGFLVVPHQKVPAEFSCSSARSTGASRTSWNSSWKSNNQTSSAFALKAFQELLLPVSSLSFWDTQIVLALMGLHSPCLTGNDGKSLSSCWWKVIPGKSLISSFQCRHWRHWPCPSGNKWDVGKDIPADNGCDWGLYGAAWELFIFTASVLPWPSLPSIIWGARS